MRLITGPEWEKEAAAYEDSMVIFKRKMVQYEQDMVHWKPIWERAQNSFPLWRKVCMMNALLCSPILPMISPPPPPPHIIKQ